MAESGEEHEIRVFDVAQIRTRAELMLPNIERQLRESFIRVFSRRLRASSKARKRSARWR